MATLDRLVKLDNLRRAWRWVRSNPSPGYKNYFRQQYGNYAVAEEQLLPDLFDRLKKGIFKPAHSCKVYLPKASGRLRPYTLLTVEDQIVYRAYVNVIAERFLPEIGPRYLSEVFSHLYAGPTSQFFYRRWEEGFRAFNAAARRAFASGQRFTARFDLTACYDSLDHNVLKHFLADLGCDAEFCRRLCDLLTHWTATGLNGRRIYQGHGIPQGPLGSGLVAEVVLHHFDRNRDGKFGGSCLRYVDDVRLFAKTEKEVRTAVYELDLLSKEIGLFPQTAKIEIHEVRDIEQEIKSVSRPDDEAFDWDDVERDQDRVHGLIAELSPRCRVTDVTRFKYLLSKARPRAATNGRLWRVMGHHPELYGSLLSYFRRYTRLPKKDGDRLIAELKGETTHGVKIADMIMTAEGRVSKEQELAIDNVARRHWRNRTRVSADLTAAVGRWSFRRGLLTAEQAVKAVRTLPEWHARCNLVSALDTRVVPQPGLNEVLLSVLDDPVSDVAISAASHLGVQETSVAAATPMHGTAAPVLNAFGVLDGNARRPCGINHAFERLLGGKAPQVDWPLFFSRTYRRAEIQAVRWSGYLTDATAWVNGMDVFCDWMLDALYRADPSIKGVYKLGSIGSVPQPGSPLQKAYPKVFRLAHDVHGKRLSSDLSHPKKRVGSTYIKPTSFIRFGYFRTAKGLVRDALGELAQRWPVSTQGNPARAVGASA